MPESQENRLKLFSTSIGDDLPKHNSKLCVAWLLLDDDPHTRVTVTISVAPKGINLIGQSIEIEIEGGETISRPLGYRNEATFPKLPVGKAATVYLTLPEGVKPTD